MDQIVTDAELARLEEATLEERIQLLESIHQRLQALLSDDGQ